MSKDETGYVLDDKIIAKIQDTINLNKPLVIIGAGIDAMQAFKSFEKHSNVMFIWSGHQLPNVVRENLEILNAVALPESSVDQGTINELAQKKVKFIPTINVPNEKSKESVIKSYENWKENNNLIKQTSLVNLVIRRRS